ncbi:hypothetical protein HYS29_00415 [Candidatus Microgenomates bacterium]|nr:hypothetical protein [Candidatus Microgenomates bacterium]
MIIKLKTELTALCDYALLSNDGKLSIIGIFDELRVTQLPSMFVDKFLVATVQGEPSKSYLIKMKLIKDGKDINLLNPLSLKINTSFNGKSNLIVRLANVQINEEGDYYFKIYNEDIEIGKILLKVGKVLSNRNDLNDSKQPN